MLRCAGGNTFPIVGTGTLRLSLRSGEGVVCATSMNVSHIPGLSHHILLLRRIAESGNKYNGTRKGIRMVFAKSSIELFAPLYGQLNSISVYRTDRSSEQKVHVVIAQGATPTPSTAADINDFHCAYGHIARGSAAQDGEADWSKARGTAGALSRVLGGERD